MSLAAMPVFKLVEKKWHLASRFTPIERKVESDGK